MRISAATETRLWITHVIMPIAVMGTLVYVKNKERIHNWVEKQKIKKHST